MTTVHSCPNCDSPFHANWNTQNLTEDYQEITCSSCRANITMKITITIDSWKEDPSIRNYGEIRE